MKEHNLTEFKSDLKWHLFFISGYDYCYLTACFANFDALLAYIFGQAKEYGFDFVMRFYSIVCEK